MKAIKTYGSTILILSGLSLGFQNCSSPSGPEPELQNQERQEEKSKSAAADWSQSQIELATFGAYSPASLSVDRLWFGGWISAQDPNAYLDAMVRGIDPRSVFGPDKIYVTDVKDSLNATASATKLALALPGYHINDPTVIVPPSTDGVNRSKWLYMYFTMLDNHRAESCRRSGKELLDCRQVFEGHDVGFASSIDGGLTWTYRGIVIRADQSGDARGAWMPTVVREGNEIHLYYSSGSDNFQTPNLFRQRLNANGISALASAEAVKIANFRSGQLFANVDIQIRTDSKGQKRYLMVANSGNQKNIHGFHSKDGLEFTELKESPLLSAEGTDSLLLTPQIHNWGEELLSETFETAGARVRAVGFVFLKFTRKGESSAYEFRRQDAIRFSLNP